MELPTLRNDWALFLDVDGTLVDFADRPDGVRITQGVVSLIQRLLEVLDGAVALVSGRRIAELDRMFAPLHLPAAGLHGLQYRIDQHIHSSDVLPVLLDVARERLRSFAADHPGVIIEDKGLALALHYRRTPSASVAVRSVAREILTSLGGAFHLQEGKMVIEVKPNHSHKGVVIQRFMTEPRFANRTPVFVGDDVTDEDGFDAVNQLNGYSVRVGGAAETRATWTLAGVPDVLQWLGRGLDALTVSPSGD